jgi:hypothetical protein
MNFSMRHPLACLVVENSKHQTTVVIDNNKEFLEESFVYTDHSKRTEINTEADLGYANETVADTPVSQGIKIEDTRNVS